MNYAAKALIFDESDRILVLYRSGTHPTLAHDIDLPGGIIETGESVELGLVREIQEETGLSVGVETTQLQYSWLSRFGQEQAVYRLELDSSCEVRISWEHEAHDWISVEEMINFPAIDGFIHHVQDWLRTEYTDLNLKTLSLQSSSANQITSARLITEASADQANSQLSFET